MSPRRPIDDGSGTYAPGKPRKNLTLGVVQYCMGNAYELLRDHDYRLYCELSMQNDLGFQDLHFHTNRDIWPTCQEIGRHKPCKTDRQNDAHAAGVKVGDVSLARFARGLATTLPNHAQKPRLWHQLRLARHLHEDIRDCHTIGLTS
jgi:hypothetical protein